MIVMKKDEERRREGSDFERRRERLEIKTEGVERKEELQKKRKHGRERRRE